MNRHLFTLLAIVALTTAACGSTSLEDGLDSQYDLIIDVATAVAPGVTAEQTTAVVNEACYNDVTGDSGENDRSGAVWVAWTLASEDAGPGLLAEVRSYWEEEGIEVIEASTTKIQDSDNGLSARYESERFVIAGNWGCSPVDDDALLTCDTSAVAPGPPCTLTESIVIPS